MASRPTSNCTSILVVRESFLPRTDRSEKISQMGREDRGRNKGLVSTTVVRRGFTPFLFHEVEEGSSPGYVHSCSGEKFVHRPNEERKKQVFPNVFRCPTSLFDVSKFGQHNRNVGAWKKRAWNHRVTCSFDSLPKPDALVTISVQRLNAAAGHGQKRLPGCPACLLAASYSSFDPRSRSTVRRVNTEMQRRD